MPQTVECESRVPLSCLQARVCDHVCRLSLACVPVAQARGAVLSVPVPGSRATVSRCVTVAEARARQNGRRRHGGGVAGRVSGRVADVWRPTVVPQHPHLRVEQPLANGGYRSLVRGHLVLAGRGRSRVC